MRAEFLLSEGLVWAVRLESWYCGGGGGCRYKLIPGACWLVVVVVLEVGIMMVVVVVVMQVLAVLEVVLVLRTR